MKHCLTTNLLLFILCGRHIKIDIQINIGNLDMIRKPDIASAVRSRCIHR